MKKILIPAALIAAAILSGAAKKNDPTLMTVNGKPVKVSEFTYLYNKNNQQQAEPQTLDEYVDMFVNYRLKVADAEAAGLDTTAAFKKEYDGYCDDLAKPFLTDSTVVEKLSREAYERMKKNVKVSHIMLPIGRTPDERMANRDSQRRRFWRYGCEIFVGSFGSAQPRFDGICQVRIFPLSV